MVTKQLGTFEPQGISPAAQKNLNLQLRQIMIRQGLLALVAILAGALVWHTIAGALWGALAGLGDSGLVLWGIARGMRKTPERAAAYMRRMMFTRLAYLLFLTLLSLKLQGQTALVLLGFVFFNVTLLVYMAVCHIEIYKTKRK